MSEIEIVVAEELKQHLQPAWCARFREGRKGTGVQLRALCAALGKSEQAILQFETGKQRLDLEVFVQACELLRLNVRWVLTGRGAMREPGARPSAALRPPNKPRGPRASKAT